MKFKHMAFLIMIMFVLSCFNIAFAHPGHGCEYVEEVSSSDSSQIQQVQSSESDSEELSKSSEFSSLQISSGESSVSGSSSYSSNNVENSNSLNEDNISEVNNSGDNPVEDGDSDFFTVSNFLILLIALLMGFLFVVLIFRYI